MRRGPLVVSALASLLLAAPGAARDECRLVASYLLEPEKEPELGVSIHRCAGVWKLDLERFLGRSDDGAAHWRVVHSLALADLRPDAQVVWQTCRLGDVADAGIAAVAPQTDEEDFSGIRAAWRADRERARWIPLDASRVHCWNEDAGFS